LSFGGWSFSTDYDTFPIFRQGVTVGERQTFANNVASFIVDNGLDGVDFDWEYPGAPDIPGIPPGSPDDGPNYLDFLRLVRAALPAGKSLAIAAPASYWYLRGFPIADIANVVDYIVYMTYDLHGQWDYGNAFSE
jgi:GH18 family chitinase